MGKQRGWRGELAAVIARGRESDGAAAVAAALGDALAELAAAGDGPVPPLDPPEAVLGVDGCRGGWVGVLLRPGGVTSLHMATRIDALVEQVRAQERLGLVAIDIPIGLPDRNGRAADRLARRELPGKGSSIFSTPTRAAYEAGDYDAARAANIAASDSGTSLSKQAWALRTKVLEVDAWLRTRPTVAVIEAHPELSFARLDGAPVAANKHTPDGLAGRRRLLERAGVAVPAMYAGMGFEEDDLLDACVLTWTAVRHLTGRGERFPDPPEVFSDGHVAAIHV